MSFQMGRAPFDQEEQETYDRYQRLMQLVGRGEPTALEWLEVCRRAGSEIWRREEGAPARATAELLLDVCDDLAEAIRVGGS